MKRFFIVLLSLCFNSNLFAQTENQKSMQDWEYPYEVHHVQLTDSIKIAYIDEGESKCTLLFLHGLGSYLKAWTKNIEVLKEDYRCIALDLPGYGKSSKKNEVSDMTFFAETVRSFMNELKLKKVILVGHSMGGQVAMHTVLNDDQNIKKLILIAPAGFETFTEKESVWLQSVYNAELIKATTEEQIAKNFEINFFKMPDDARFMIDDRLHMRQTMEYDDYCEMVPKCVKGMLDEPVFECLSNIKIPVLVVYGENDYLIPNKYLHPSLTPIEVAESGQKRIPKSRLKMIPRAGHFVQWEQSEEVNNVILKFLK